MCARCCLLPPPFTPHHTQIAAALQAEKLILMTDVPGVLRDKDDVSTKFNALNIRECRQLTEEGIIAGGMIPKVCVHRALHNHRRGRAHQYSLVHSNPFPPLWLPSPPHCPPHTLTNPHFLAALPSLSPPPAQVQCCIRCLSQGVNAAHIIDGRSKHSVLMELLTDEVG